VTLVAIPLFPGFTALDAIGPYEVLQRIPSIDVVFVGHHRGEVRSENGMLGVSCDATFDEVGAPDVVVFPGGIGTRQLIHDDAIRACVHRRTVARRRGLAQWTHRDNALAGRRPAQRWVRTICLNESSSIYRGGSSPPRVCPAASTWRCGWLNCSLMVSAAQAAQLLIEYDPQPPFHSGALAKADEATVARANEYLQARQ
jgi:DJ-1/PfpI family